jgi:antitoxin MazE
VITKVQKWGTSQGIRLSRELLAQASIAVGDTVDVVMRDGVLVVLPVRRLRGRMDMEQLIREIPAGYRPGELDWGPRAGREVW